MNKPTISIIIPIYNSEKYLHSCLDSIIAQTFGNWEVILVDDGSTDASGVICDEYAGKDSRFRVSHETNGGVSSARNKGLDLSIGEWVLFIDSDDTVPADALENMIAPTLDNESIDFVMGGYTVYDEDGTITHDCKEQVQEELFNADIIRYLYQPKYYRYWGYICSKLYRLAIVRKFGVHFDESIYFNEDRLFCAEYLSNIHNKAVLFTTSCYNYVEHSTGVMSSLNTGYNRRFVTDLDAFVKMKKVVKNMPNNRSLLSLADDGICNSYVRNMNMMIQNKKVDSVIHKYLLRQLFNSGAGMHFIKTNILRPFVLLFYPRLLIRQ